MPRQQWGRPLTYAATKIGGALLDRSDRLREEKSQKDELDAWSRSVDLANNFPDVYREVQSGKIRNVGVAANAVNQRQEQEKAQRGKDDDRIRDAQEKTLNLANLRAGSSDPTAPRANLDLPQFRAMPGGAPAPRIPGGQEIPDAGMVGQFEEMQTARPAISPTERADVMRSRLRPGDQGLAGVAGRSIGMADERLERLQKKTLALSIESKEPTSPSALAEGNATFEQMATYGGMTGPEMQKRAREGEPTAPQRPTWDRQARIAEADRRGLVPDSPERFDFIMKEPGDVTATQERAYSEKVKFAEIEKLADQIFPSAAEGEDDPSANAKKQWIRNAKLDYLKQHPVSGDPLAAQFASLTERLRQIDAAIDAEMQK